MPKSGRSNCPSSTSSTCSPTRPAPGCTSGTLKATPPRTFCPGIAAPWATMFCIRSAGTPSGCPLSNTPSRPGSIPARPPSRTSQPSNARLSRWASATTGAASSTPPTRCTSSGHNGSSSSSTTRGSTLRPIKPSQSRLSSTLPNWSVGQASRLPVPRVSRPSLSGNAAPTVIPSAWPMSPKLPSGGASNWEPSSPTKKSWTARARLVTSLSFASRCANGCCASPPMPNACLGTSKPLNGATRSRKCSATGLGAARERRWTLLLRGARKASAYSLPGRTRCMGRPTWCWRPNTSWWPPSPRRRSGRPSRRTRRRLPRRATSNAPNWRKRRPECLPAVMLSTRLTGKGYPSGLPTTCSSATAPAQLWLCRVTTRVTSSLPRSSTCPSSRSSNHRQAQIGTGT